MSQEVIKRDGSIEPFQPEKIVRVVKAAGLESHQAQDLVLRVAKWVKIQNRPQISTLEIREKVIEGLRKVNQNAANLFTWYQKTKDNNKV